MRRRASQPVLIMAGRELGRMAWMDTEIVGGVERSRIRRFLLFVVITVKRFSAAGDGVSSGRGSGKSLASTHCMSAATARFGFEDAGGSCRIGKKGVI